MVSIRRRRLQSLRPPVISEGTGACIPELEPIVVPNINDRFNHVRPNRSLGQSSHDHEPAKDHARRSEDLVAPAFPVPQRRPRTPLHHVKPRKVPIWSVVARSRPAEVRILPDLNQEPIMDLQLRLGLGGHAITALPVVKRRSAVDASSPEEDDSLVSESVQRDAPAVMPSGESRDRCLEVIYLDSGRESPPVSQERLAAVKRGKSIVTERGKSIVVPELVDDSTQRRKYNTRSPFLHASRSVDNVKSTAAAAGSSGHYLRSRTVHAGQADEGDEAPEEGSVLHAVYCVVLVSGENGISKEDVLVSLHDESRPATLVHTDWEAEVKQCLKSRLFAQVLGQYVLRKHSRRDHPSSSKGKETISLSSEESADAGLTSEREFERNEVQERVLMNNVMDHGIGNGGSLMVMREKIEDEYRATEERRQCAMPSASVVENTQQKKEDHEHLEHHFKKAKVKRLQAKVAKMKKKIARMEAKIYQLG